MVPKEKMAALEKRLSRLDRRRPMSAHDASFVKTHLGVILSEDFEAIGKLCHFEYLHSFDWAGLISGAVEYTEEYRAHGLPHRFIVLADQGDAGSILLETQDSPETPSPVIWCDYEDLLHVCAEGTFAYNPTIWPSFRDFFEYLVEQEEAKLKDDA